MRGRGLLALRPALQRCNHTKLHHWEMLLAVAQPDFSPALEEEEGGVDGSSLHFCYSNASLAPTQKKSRGPEFG